MLITNLFYANRANSNLARNGKSRRRRADRKSAQRFSYAPRFESLEGRDMLSAISVVNLADSGPGSLRDAIAVANAAPDHDVISFAPSVQGAINLTGELGITEDLTINGPGPGKLTVSGSGLTRVFSTEAVVSINNLTISDGHVTGRFNSGAGIRNGGELSLDHVVMSNNQAIDTPYGGGGAVFSLFGTLHVSNSSFQNNRATNSTSTDDPVAGGAIASVLSNTDIRNSSFSDNEVDSGVSIGLGGAISATFGGTLLVSNSRFEGNSVASDVDARGGAIAAAFEGNPAVPFLSLFVTVDHSQFVGNSAEGDLARGGAIFAEVSSFDLDSSSIVFNKVEGMNAQGGGIYSGPGLTDAATVTVTRTNVNANQAAGDNGGNGVGGGIYNAAGGTFEIDTTSNVHGNKASTSHDDVFGDLTLLNALLAV